MSPVARETAVTSDVPSCDRLNRPPQLIALLISKSAGIWRNRPKGSAPPGQLPELPASVRGPDHIEAIRVARPCGQPARTACRGTVAGPRSPAPDRAPSAQRPHAIQTPSGDHAGAWTADACAQPNFRFARADTNLDQPAEEWTSIVEGDPGTVGRPFRARTLPTREVSLAGAPPFDGEIQIVKLWLNASLVPSGENAAAANLV